MSIKYKIPLIMLSAFLLNVLILFGYYQFYISDRVETYQNNMSQAVMETVEELSEKISGMTLKEAEKQIASFDNPRDFVFRLYNFENQELYENQDNTGHISFSKIRTLHLAEGAFILQAEKQIDLFNLHSQNVFRDLIFFEILALFIIFSLMGVYIYFSYVRGLLKLKTKMSEYKNGKKPESGVYRRDEIGQLESGFFLLSQSLYEEKQVQNRIIASISHDIKTPLTSVLGYSERIAKKELDAEKQKQYIRTIYQQAKDLEAIVDEFDDYLIASASEKNQMQQIKVSYICNMLEEEYETLLLEKGITFSVINTCDPAEAIQIDLLKLRRVFANIISNSIRHAGAEKALIEVSAEKKNGLIAIKISDNGKGVPESSLPYIFEPFHTSDPSRRMSGLGLTICRQIVEGHSGVISAYNNKDGGLTVEFELCAYAK